MDRVSPHARRLATLAVALAALLSCVLLSGVSPTWGQAVAVGGPARATASAALGVSALQPGADAVVAVVVDVGEGFHAQSHAPLDDFLIPFSVSADDAASVAYGDVQYPPATIETYPALGRVSVYTGRAIAYVPVKVSAGAAAGAVTLSGSVRLQVCDDQSCFAPTSLPWSVETEVVPAGRAVGAGGPGEAALFAGFDPASVERPTAEAVGLRGDLEDSGGAETGAGGLPRIDFFGVTVAGNAYALIFAGAFVVGIVFNAVPCVLPVLPLKAMGFYEVAQHDRAKCVALGAVFSLGLVATFGLLAVVVVVLNLFSWGEQFSNPWFAGALVLLLLAMASGMFGLFNVGLPSKVYGLAPRHDTYSGNFAFGVLTAVLSTPCTFGAFLGVLVWAAAAGTAVGVALVMTVGVGMASPYLVLSAFPGLARNFPRSGPWAEVVKQMMAFLLVATALFFGRPFLPAFLRDETFWWLLFGVVAVAGVFLLARTATLAPRVGPIAVASVVALLLVGPALAATLKLTNVPLRWVDYSPAALADARSAGRPVLVKFTADWCANCHYLAATVYADDAVVDAVRSADALPLKADLSDESAVGWALLREVSPVGAIPITAVWPAGADRPVVLTGLHSEAELIAALSRDEPPRVANAE